jgi:hypothetical protein
VQLPEREQKLWDRVAAERASEGVPLAVCSTITPLPFWGVIVAIVVFIPLALILSFFMKRQAVIVQGRRIVVLELSFWRFNVTGKLTDQPLAPESVRLERNALVIDGQKLHLQPGWDSSALRIVELAEAG